MREAAMEPMDQDFHEDCGHYHGPEVECPEGPESCGDYRCCQP